MSASSVAEKPDPGYERGLVFVIMAFAPSMDDVYTVISEECKKLRLGLRSRRGDEGMGAGALIDEIAHSIVRAEFIICDLTDERPNVYYELGYAHGVGNQPLDIFLTARAGTELHFDIRGRRVQFYNDFDHLRELMRTRFKKQVLERRKQG